MVGLLVVNYINRREIGNDTNKKPLNAMQKGIIIITYSRVWTKIVSYIWRTYILEEVKPGNREEEDGEEKREGERIKGKKLAYRFII